MKYYQKLAQAFLKRWEKEYLINFREQHISYKNKPKSEDTMNKGKIVLIQLHRGKDGLVRSVTLRTAKKKKQISRPIEKFYPLELSSKEAQMEKPQLKEFEDEKKKETRTPQAAAQRAVQRIKELSKDIL